MSESIFSRVPLSELCTLKNGYGFEPKDWTDYGFPIIRIQNLNGGSDFNYFAGRYPAGYVVDPGDLLFAWSGNRGTSFGPFIWRGPRGLLNQHIFKVTPKPNVPQAWLYHALHIARDNAERQAHGGSGLVHVKRGELLSFEIPIPPPHQRDKLANILDMVDRAIEQTDALIAKYQRIKTGLMQDLLSRGIDENGCLRPIRTEAAKLYEESELGFIPNGWRVRQIHETARVIDSLHRTPIFVSEGPAMARVTDIKGGTLELHAAMRVTPIVYREFTRNHQPGRGDIVVSRVGSYGISSYVKTEEPFCIGQNTAVVTGHPVSRFLFELLQTPIVKRQFDFAVGGSSQKTLSLKAIRETLILDPPQDEQHAIADWLGASSKQIELAIRIGEAQATEDRPNAGPADRQDIGRIAAGNSND